MPTTTKKKKKSTNSKKTRIKKRCHVCGDVALSFNFNGISCESCRYFFRRYAVDYNEMKCIKRDESCVITIETRRLCKRCRMNKCLAIGMRFELISKINKTSTTIVNNSHRVIETVITPSTVPFSHLFRNLLDVFRCFSPKIVGTAADTAQIFTIQQFVIRSIITFAKSIAGFRNIETRDQLVLLKSAFPEILLFRSLFYFDFARDSFPMRLDEAAECGVMVPLDLLYYRQFRLSHLIELHRRLATIVAAYRDDNILRDIMTIVILFKPNKPSINRPESLRYEFSRYRYLLRRYLETKYSFDDDHVRDGGGELSQLQCVTTYESLMSVIDDVAQLKTIFYKIYAKTIEEQQRQQQQYQSAAQYESYCETKIKWTDICYSLLEIYDIDSTPLRLQVA